MDDKAKGYRTKVMNMLRKGQFSDADGGQAAVDTYYKKFALPRWTRGEYRPMLATFHRELLTELRSAKSDPARPNLVYVYVRDKLVLPYMANFARPWAAPGQEFSPAVRVNAMIVIGELNETEPASTTEVAKPLAAALPVLVEAVDDPNQIPAVKIAALEGLKRQAKLGGAPDRKVLSATFKLVSAAAVPENQTADGHAWMRSQAAEILGDLKVAGSNGEVVKALTKMASESGSPLSARCAAARALGHLNYQGVGGVNPSEVARALAGLAVDAYKAEGDPLLRRGLKDHLTAVWLGLTGRDWSPDSAKATPGGVAGLATAPPHQAYVAGVRQALEGVLKPFDDLAKAEDNVLAEKIAAAFPKLEQAAKK